MLLNAASIDGPKLEYQCNRRLASSVRSRGQNGHRSGETHGCSCSGQRDDKHDGQSSGVLIILKDHRWSAALLLVAISGWQLDPVKIADDH
jgi:hypothetical protein